MGKKCDKSAVKEELNRNQKTFLRYHESSPSITESARKTGISRQCYYRWIKEDERFEEAIRELRERKVREGFEKGKDMSGYVMSELRKMSESADSEQIRYSALKTIAKLTLQWRKQVDVDERLTVIEAKLGIR